MNLIERCFAASTFALSMGIVIAVLMEGDPEWVVFAGMGAMFATFVSVVIDD